VWRPPVSAVDSSRCEASNALTPAALLVDLAKQLADHVNVAGLRLWRLSHDHSVLRLEAAIGPVVPFDGLGSRVPLDGTELGCVARTGRAYVVASLHESAPADVRSWASTAGIASFVALPLLLRGQVKGVLAVFCHATLHDSQIDSLKTLTESIAPTLLNEQPADVCVTSGDILPSLIQCVPAAVISLDTHGLITHWNAAAESLFGWSEAAVLGKPLPCVLEDRRHEFPDDLSRSLRPGRVLRTQTICRRIDDSLCHVQRSTSLVYDRHGEITGRIEVFVDQSRQEKTGRCLKVQSQVTRIATQCRSLEEAVPLLLAALGEWLGADLAEFWGLEDQQRALVRTTVWTRSPAGKDGLTASELRVQTASADWPAEAFRRRKLVFNDDVDCAAVRCLSPLRGPLRVPVAGLAVPIYWNATQFGVLTCIGGAIVDPDDLTRQTLIAIGEATAQLMTRVKTESELARSNADLRQTQKMDAVGLLAGGVAHDFNNLLTIILAYSEMGLAEVDPEHPLRELFAEVHSAGVRAAEMTRQLLAVSRQQPTQMVTVDLNRLFADLQRMLQRLIGPSIELRFAPGEDLASVDGDVNQLEQVLLNLVVNARDAMPDGGPIAISTRNVQLTAAELAGSDVRPGAFVELAVRDSGCGMDAQTKARIFEPFFTTKEPGQGTGMGLSMVFGIVKQAGGVIRVESEPQAGTCFGVLLPQSRRILAPRAVHEQPRVSPRGTERILVVEHDASVRHLIRRLLEVRGYTIEEADDGGRALQMLSGHTHQIDLVLADTSLPTIDGRNLARRLRTLPDAPRLLLMSGNAQGVGDPANSSSPLLLKPFTSDTLSREVRNVLDAKP
jgi:two-component system, cell cycle sensor histidine kinase and response regulator CckA